MVYISTMIYIIQYDSCLNQKNVICDRSLEGTWRIIPLSKVVRITPIYKPWKGKLEEVPQPDPEGTYQPWLYINQFVNEQ